MNFIALEKYQQEYLIIRNYISDINTLCISLEYNVIHNYICKLSPKLFQSVLIELNNIKYICKQLMNTLLYYEPIDDSMIDITDYYNQLIYAIENFAYKIENGYYNCECCVLYTAYFEYFEDMIYILEKCINRI